MGAVPPLDSSHDKREALAIGIGSVDGGLTRLNVRQAGS